MYLSEVFLENAGPVQGLDLVLPFNTDGSPKPVVLVGTNGSGKTVLLSHIADALVEFAKDAYTDVVEGHRAGHSPYLRMVSWANQRCATEYALALLRFAEADKAFFYVEKTGTLSPDALASKLGGRFSPVRSWPETDNHKAHHPATKEAYESFFGRAAVCYFPASRREAPHWLNRDAVHESPGLGAMRLKGVLGKPVVVESSAEENRRWLWDVIVDSRPDVQLVENEVRVVGDIQPTLLLLSARRNLEEVLSSILCKKDARLVAGHRGELGRLSVEVEGQRLVPGLENLSAGQAVLFNTFATIIRYADRADVNRSVRLADIEGIVLIDEVDAHLHTELQYEVLPELLQLFPKVQFVLSSHSPLLLLGMEKTFGAEGVQILEMPAGRVISSERFSEFRRSYDYVRKTATVEADVTSRAKDFRRPVVLTEGRSDVKIIRAAWEKLRGGRTLPFDVIPSGVDAEEEKRCGGAESVRRMLEFLPSVTNQPVIGLFDNDREGNKQFKGLHKQAFEEWKPSSYKRKHLKAEVHGLLLPVPALRRLFVTEDDICQRYLSIEHYFDDKLLEAESMKGPPILSSPVFEIRGDKMKFAEYVGSLEPSAFHEFGVLFDVVLEAFGIPREGTEQISENHSTETEGSGES